MLYLLTFYCFYDIILVEDTLKYKIKVLLVLYLNKYNSKYHYGVIFYMNEVLIMTSKNLINLAVEKFSKENKVLLVLDFSGLCDEDKAKYINAVKQSDVLTEKQLTDTLENGALLIVVPYFTVNAAVNDYRKIKHASHFASLWADGKKYDME